MNLTDHQKEALAVATSGKVGLLTGFPGTGKTTAVGVYIRELLSQPGNGGVVASALSSAAARRLTIKMKDAGINLEATTTHRMLAYQYYEGQGIFGHNRSNPIPAAHIFIDEDSMQGAEMHSHVLAARRKGAQIIFIGDIEQVSPIGHGAPLRDMIDMRLPHGHLSEIHRNAGRVVKCCKMIAEHQQFESSSAIDVAARGVDHDDENLFVEERFSTPIGQQKAIEAWLTSSEMFDVDGINDPIWDVQVIAPLRKKGSDLSCHALNPKIQTWLNGGGKQAKGNPFREGDKVMCVENGWYSPAPGCPPGAINDDSNVYVANGNLGKVIEVDSRWTIVQFDLPERLVRFGKAKAKTANDNDVPTGRLELGYCGTVHKFQGSQAPGIIFVGDESGGSNFVCDRHVVLTAISRMERLCVCVAKQQKLKDWCRKSKLRKIRTFAVEKFKELICQ